MPKDKRFISINKILTSGKLFYDGKRYEDALTCFKKVTKFDPKHFIAWNNLGAAYYALGELEEAQKTYEKVIELAPDHIDTLFNLGVLFKVQGKYDKAVDLFKKVSRLTPTHPMVHTALGQILMDLGRFPQAEKEYQKSISIDPALSEPHNQLGNVYRETGKIKEAVICYQTAIAVNPGYTQAWANLASAYYIEGDLAATEKTLRKAIAISPDTVNLYYLLADILGDQGRPRETIDILRQAIKVDPGFIKPYDLLIGILRGLCDWDEIKKLEKHLIKKGSENPFSSLLRQEDPAKNYETAHDWCELIKKKLPPVTFSYKKKSSKDKIRLGYLSRDFHDHPVGQMIASMFGYHDRSKFEVYAFAFNKNYNDVYQKRIKREVDKYVDIVKMRNPTAAKIINQNQIDILIDLGGHTTDNRFEICALKPAPIQAAWLGYPATTGGDFMDYIVVDKIVAPQKHAPFYSEKFAYLPRCYQINNSEQSISKTKYERRDFGLPEEEFVSVSFNKNAKIEPTMWGTWMNILKRVPKSVLWLWKQEDEAMKNLRSYAKKAGVNPKRIIFSERLPKEEHLARMSLSDLALDTKIYGGHTTTSDMLWAGVPVITKVGDYFASRVAASILTEAELPELITRSLKAYEDKAVYLANNPSELRKIKSKITHEHLRKNLYDTKGFVRNLEKAFLSMWKLYQKGEDPRQIEIEG